MIVPQAKQDRDRKNAGLSRPLHFPVRNLLTSSGMEIENLTLTKYALSISILKLEKYFVFTKNIVSRPFYTDIMNF